VGGGCSRAPRADVDAAIGLPCLSKTVTGGWVVSARALAADAAPEEAVRSVLGVLSPRS
jgi:hypothetical protein